MKLKSLYIFFFLLLIGTSLMAQDKYEQAVVKQIGGSLYISIEGQEHKRIKIDKNEIADAEDLSAALKEMAKMRSDGWDVWNSACIIDGGISRTVYFLRRKLK